jgi:hypothetical protein
MSPFDVEMKKRSALFRSEIDVSDSFGPSESSLASGSADEINFLFRYFGQLPDYLG